MQLDMYINLLLIITGIMHVVTAKPIFVKPLKDQSVHNQLPKLGRPFRLTCDGASPPVTITWLKDNTTLTLDSRMSLSLDNVTLSFSLMEESDSGQYQCKVINGNDIIISKAYWMHFEYVVVSLTGPNRAEVGMKSQYTCDVQCGKECTLEWAWPAGFPQGGFIAEGPRIIWTPSEIGQIQVFTCIALNSTAVNIGQVSKTVTVVEAQPLPPKPSNAVSTKPSVAMMSSAILLMLVSACV